MFTSLSILCWICESGRSGDSTVAIVERVVVQLFIVFICTGAPATIPTSVSWLNKIKDT